MPVKETLSAGEREFFSLVQRAARANPFLAQRAGLDRQIGQDLGGQAAGSGVSGAIRAVRGRIEGLDQRGAGLPNQYADADKRLLEKALLFDFFYSFRKQFDEHILQQMAGEEKPLKLAFANEAVFHLSSRGFSPEAICRAMELAFQFRRAFFFINQCLTGRAPCIQRLRADAWNNIFTHDVDLYQRYMWDRMEDFTTLVLGETGTGKGAVATAIGRSGYIAFNLRKQKFEENFQAAFLSINLSQYAESLMESELFGHKKGSFTGAVDNHQGLLSRCGPHGTILLDEIGELTHPVQIKLLQVLQDRVFYPVGGKKMETFRGRVIAATNQPLEELREKGRFREDFYYRLCSDVIFVPTLRQRLAEDPRELDDLLEILVGRIVGRPSPELAAMVKEAIHQSLGADYPWHGNVRELEQCVRRVLLRREYSGDRDPQPKDARSRLVKGVEEGALTAQLLLGGYCAMLYQRHGSYEEVARQVGLDRRTVQKYVLEWENQVD